ncbi:hypothetical protein CR159_07265 [Pollutimonas subterranea]|uniref:Lipoprotein n=1 Tax=Pollutimonas subterranea TaxID=2045210 RepID=A0A2N4U6Y7_9BURK|nr:hypothetical protein [Pollutimonas subterranea]PLC50785.1 hypothetical protein CR159_07265 [Pollutimonas subterranea]
MKLQYWVTIVAASTLWGPACVWAQGAHGVPPLPVPHAPEHQPDGAGNFLPDIVDPALPNRHVPNRRVPSLAPPQPGDTHPITPDEAWGKPPPLIKPALPTGRSGSDSSTAMQPLNGTGSEGIQDLLRTDK